MLSVKNIVRAALLAAAANNANAGLLAGAVDAMDGAPGSEAAAAAIDGATAAAALVDGAMRAGDPDEATDMPGMDNVPQAIRDAMTSVADLKEGFTEGLPDMPDMPDMPNLDLDETLQSVMDFEAKLFGAEGDKLIEYITELKGAEQGHNDAVKEAIDKLEDYRRTATGSEMLPKEDADRAVLVAEIFTAMIATSPVEMVAEAITALKAADEAPSVEQLEQLKDMMVGGLTGAEIATFSKGLPEAPDMPDMPDMPGMPNLDEQADAMTSVADLKEGFTEGLPDMPDMPNLDLDETLQSVMDFEATLFGAEGDNLIEYITELKGAEQGHNDAVKEAIDKLEDYRRTATGTEMLPKEDADRAVLVAEIFTAMIATSPVEMVAETITVLKAADEAPSIEQLEQLKDMMVGGLTGAEIASLQTSDGDVFVDAPEAPTAAAAALATDKDFCTERALTTEVSPRIVKAVQKLNLCRRALPILEHEHLEDMKVLKTVTRAELVNAGMRIGDAHRLLAAVNKQPASSPQPAH